LGLGLVVGGTLLVEGTSLVEGKLPVGGKLLVEGILLAGGKLPAAGEGTEELTEEGGVAGGHTEQAVGGVPALAPEDGVGTGAPETGVTVPEGLGVGGTAKSVESGRGTEVGLPEGIVVGVGTGNELSVRVLVGRPVGEGELGKLPEATGTGVTAEGSAGPKGLTTGVIVGAGVMVEDNEFETPEGVGIAGVRVMPVLSKVDVTSPGTWAGESWIVSLVITIVSLIMVFGSGLGSRFS